MRIIGAICSGQNNDSAANKIEETDKNNGANDYFFEENICEKKGSNFISSKNKLSFMGKASAEGARYTGQSLTVEDVSEIKKIYERKLKAKILINGEHKDALDDYKNEYLDSYCRQAALEILREIGMFSLDAKKQIIQIMNSDSELEKNILEDLSKIINLTIIDFLKLKEEAGTLRFDEYILGLPNASIIKTILLIEFAPLFVDKEFMREGDRFNFLKPDDFEKFNRKISDFLNNSLNRNNSVALDVKLDTELKEDCRGISAQRLKKELHESYKCYIQIPIFVLKKNYIPTMECLEEIKSLISSEKGFKGYFYTSKVTSGQAHFETCVITPQGAIINPIYFTVPSHLRTKNIYTAKISDLISRRVKLFIENNKVTYKKSNIIDISPQSTEYECGSLGLSYLNKYLKDDAFQLKNRTLMIDLQGKENTSTENEIKFHLPSPEALKYSQSALFNKLCRAVVNLEDHIVKVQHKEYEYEMVTLGGMIKNQNATISRPGDSDKMNKEELKEFCMAWIKDYEKWMEYREEMQAPDGTNLYLKYKSHRFFEKTLADKPFTGNDPILSGNML